MVRRSAVTPAPGGGVHTSFSSSLSASLGNSGAPDRAGLDGVGAGGRCTVVLVSLELLQRGDERGRLRGDASVRWRQRSDATRPTSQGSGLQIEGKENLAPVDGRGERQGPPPNRWTHPGVSPGAAAPTTGADPSNSRSPVAAFRPPPASPEVPDP